MHVTAQPELLRQLPVVRVTAQHMKLHDVDMSIGSVVTLGSVRFIAAPVSLLVSESIPRRVVLLSFRGTASYVLHPVTLMTARKRLASAY